MTQWKHLFILLASLAISTALYAVTPIIIEKETETTEYNCTVTLLPVKSISSKSTVKVFLESLDQNNALTLSLTRAGIGIALVKNSVKTNIVQIPDKAVPGMTYKLDIMRRGEQLYLLHNDKLLFHRVLASAGGTQYSYLTDPSWKVQNAVFQQLEAVYFTDDFMRTAEENGPWTVQSGQWSLQSAWDKTPHGNTRRFENTIYAQNPFAWIGANLAGGYALCSTGQPTWDSYTYTVAVRPSNSTAVGVAVNMPDGKNGLVVRWSSVTDRTTRGNQISLFKLIDGKAGPDLIKETGGFLPGQWAKLEVVSSIEGVKVYTDHTLRLTLNDYQPCRGMVGLYVEGTNSATFDDITVYGHSVDADMVLEKHIMGINQRFQIDENGMKVWSDSRNDWAINPSPDNFYWFRRNVYGNHKWLTLTVKPTPFPSGELWMILDSNAQDPKTGYRVEIQRMVNPDKYHYTLYRNNTVLAEKSVDPLSQEAEYQYKLWRIDKKIWLELQAADKESTTVIEATDPTPLTGVRPAFRANGCFVNVHDEEVIGHNMLDYSFTDSPTDWLDQGTWMPNIRWSCDPKWSFLAGWSRGDAAMWHKQRFVGDQSFEAFLGVKMEYPREREMYGNRYRDFCITICGDGHNPRSGYTGIYATTIENTKRILLLRNGEIVVSQPLNPAQTPNQGRNHRSWFDLELRKTGAQVEFQVKCNGMAPLNISYTDPTPIDGGVPAVWTTDNAISIARARINFEKTPLPRNEPQVTINDPWYPEWANVGIPLSLDFSPSWSSTGKPVSLAVKADSEPQGGEQSTKVANKQIIFTPKISGNYWYEISATDTINTSWPFHLTLPVFDPSLKRDDSHALVLYRFNEGTGKIVHDSSNKTPEANLTIYTDTASGPLSAQWLPGQGLALRGNTRILSDNADGPNKLQTLVKTRAMTLEFWLSTDTIYPPSKPNDWTSCLFSWDFPGNAIASQHNLAIMQNVTSLILAPRGINITGGGATFDGFRTSLLHLVITWDGTITRAYINGQAGGSRQINWATDKWSTDNLFILGNSADMRFPYLGTYYLFAVHDRCLTDAEIHRNYLAGPSAK